MSMPRPPQESVEGFAKRIPIAHARQRENDGVMMGARVGMVTGRGLAGVVRRRYPRPVLWGTCILLVIANVINIGADLGGMAEATEMVTGIDSRLWTPVYAGLIVSFLFFSSYDQMARIFKWMTLILFSYLAAALLANPHWPTV